MAERLLQLTARGEFVDAVLRDPTRSGITEGSLSVRLPDPASELSPGYTTGQFLDDLHQGQPALHDDALRFGGLLHEALFPPGSELARRWAQARRDAQAEGHGLRLELCLDRSQGEEAHSQSVAALPFELLATPEAGFLFRQHRWHLVRSLRGLKVRPATLTAGAGLKVLVAWANTAQEKQPPYDEALFTAHEEAVEAVAADLGLTCLKPVRHADRAALSRALDQGAPVPFLVWVGHGVPDGGRLVLHDPTQDTHPKDRGRSVTARDFAGVIRRGRVEVALLWSCHGAGRRGALDPGVAEALLDPAQGNLSAVLAAHAAVDAKKAAAFGRALLRAWSDGAEELEQAVAEARLALEEDDLGWAVPVLYGRPAPMQSVAAFDTETVDAAQELSDAPGLTLLVVPEKPARSPHFCGRTSEVARCTELLDRKQLVVLEGLPGVGKTELALAVAERWERDHHEHVLFVSAEGTRELSNLRARLGALVGVKEDMGAAKLAEELASLRALVILDNAEDLLPDAEHQAALRDLLAACLNRAAGMRLLVTSRRRLGLLEGVRQVVHDVAPLGKHPARQLFVSACGARLAPSQAEIPELGDLLDRLDGHPRSLVLVASQVGRGASLAELVTRLDDEGPAAVVEAVFYGYDLPDDASAGLRAKRLVNSLNVSYDGLAAADPRAAWAFELLGAFPAGLTQDVFRAAAADDTGDLLERLLEHHLVALRGEARRLVLPAPLRAYADWKRRQRPRGEWSAPLERAARATLPWLREWENELGTPGARRALRAFVGEEPNLRAFLDALAKSRTASGDAIFLHLVPPLARLFLLGGRAPDGVALLADAPWEDPAAGSPPMRARAAEALGDLHLHTS
ncbi:CHAT domain-containing protein, partial [Planctomycetota bacterium]|nr:CHAT domain-containing protein [Planctomycetota bacterium]